MNNSLQIGWSQTDITPQRAVYLHGQFYERISEYVHDPLTASALLIQADDEQAIIVSLDMVFVPPMLLSLVRKKLEGGKIDVNKISMSATHTHNSYIFGETSIKKHKSILGRDIIKAIKEPDNIMSDDEIRDFLVNKISNLIKKAWNDRKPGGISYAQDYAAIAFNRRPIFDDGETIMYGVCSRDDFMRLEGPSDHSADMLYTWDTEGNLKGVMVNIPCPSQVMELHKFISADYWHSTRNSIREELGNIFILPLCGAGGDQNPLDLIRISKNNEETLVRWGQQQGEVFRNFDMALECIDIGNRIADAVMRGYKKARNNIQTDVCLKHKVMDFVLPIRTVSEKDYKSSKNKIDDAKQRFSPENKMTMKDIVPLIDEVGVISRWEEQQINTDFTFEVHVIRLGNIVLATNPFELFTEYGMRIKAKSPAEQTFLAQISNNIGGYLPTEAAITGGSYSSKPSSTKCGPKGGDMLVERTLEIIKELF